MKRTIESQYTIAHYNAWNKIVLMLGVKIVFLCIYLPVIASEFSSKKIHPQDRSGLYGTFIHLING